MAEQLIPFTVSLREREMRAAIVFCRDQLGAARSHKDEERMEYWQWQWNRLIGDRPKEHE